MRTCHKPTVASLHAIGFVRKRLNNQLLILIPPSPHVLVRVNNSTDEVGNVLLLSALVMEGYTITWRYQGFQGTSDVDFRSTCDAKMESWNTQCGQFLHEFQYLV